MPVAHVMQSVLDEFKLLFEGQLQTPLLRVKFDVKQSSQTVLELQVSQPVPHF